MAGTQTTTNSQYNMRHLISIIIFIFIGITTHASVSPKDSLVKLANSSLPESQKISVYLNLADICFETPEELLYLKKTYKAAQKFEKKEIMLDALGELSSIFIKDDKLDSAFFYKEILKNSGTANETQGWITYLNICLFNIPVTSTVDQQGIETKLQEIRERKRSPNNIYQQLEQTCIIGGGLLNDEKYAQAIPYIKTALDIASKLPSKEAIKFEFFLLRQLARAQVFNKTIADAITTLESLLSKRETYYNNYIKSVRPFYSISSYYIQCYSSLLSCSHSLPKEKINLYLSKMLYYSKNSTNITDKYRVYIAYNNYYISTKNYTQAIITLDSLIKYAYQIAPYNIPGLFDVSSHLYNMTGEHEKAYLTLRKSYKIKDSLSIGKMNQQLSELQVKYNIDKLKYDNSLLEIKNKKIIMTFLAILLIITVFICVYQYYTLKKEKKMKKALQVLNQKAEESENMKTAFINSICHEIRTPLNAIVGFSELIFDKEIDTETRKEFPELIHKNTELLTGLVNDMLEVSNLDCSREKLPKEMVNLNELLSHQMGKIKLHLKPEINYMLHFPEKELCINTHSKYLSLAIEHLLSNANKFTKEGYISLNYRLDNHNKELYIIVEDTGCGIPKDKSEIIFQRFEKLDNYVQGTGLGLYLCSLIAERLEGNIYVDNKYTDGTRMVIKLPL